MARRTGIEPITIWIQTPAQPRRKNALARLSLLDSISRSVCSIVIEPSLPARFLAKYRPTMIECRCRWMMVPAGLKSAPCPGKSLRPVCRQLPRTEIQRRCRSSRDSVWDDPRNAPWHEGGLRCANPPYKTVHGRREQDSGLEAAADARRL